MLVSAITSLGAVKGAVANGKNNQNGNAKYDRLNYFGAKETTQSHLKTEEMFHKIALWRQFCEMNIIDDESQKETFNYLA